MGERENGVMNIPDFFILVTCFANNEWLGLAPIPEVHMIGHWEHQHMICGVKGQGRNLKIVLWPPDLCSKTLEIDNETYNQSGWNKLKYFSIM